jgi:hypothetical protein
MAIEQARLRAVANNRGLLRMKGRLVTEMMGHDNQWIRTPPYLVASSAFRYHDWTMTTKTIKTRFAPSPTGYLHLGNVRTALFNALLLSAL